MRVFSAKVRGGSLVTDEVIDLPDGAIVTVVADEAEDTHRLPGVRRVLLPRVGYFLYHRVQIQLRRLEVLAFWHSRRESSPKL